MKNNLFIALVLVIGLTPGIIFGQQQKQEIVVNKMLLPAMVTETSKTEIINPVEGSSQKKAGTLIHLQDAGAPSDGTVRTEKNGALRISKKELMPVSNPGRKPVGLLEK